MAAQILKDRRADHLRRGFDVQKGPIERVWLGTVERPRPIDSFTVDLVGHPDRVEAIKAVVRGRCLIG